MTVAENLAAVKRRIAEAAVRSARDPAVVRLIAVSKKQPDERVQAAWDAGQRDFGENYVQSLLDRKAKWPGATWHLIGHVQTNKAKGAAAAAYIHTIDSERLVTALSKVATAPLRVLLEVNLAGEAQKAGVRPEAARALAEAVLRSAKLELVGLMCIPPEDEPGRWFGALAELKKGLEQELGVALPELSMGMSGDYEQAVMAGATLVRVGTAIFGERQS